MGLLVLHQNPWLKRTKEGAEPFLYHKHVDSVCFFVFAF